MAPMLATTARTLVVAVSDVDFHDDGRCSRRSPTLCGPLEPKEGSNWQRTPRLKDDSEKEQC